MDEPPGRTTAGWTDLNRRAPAVERRRSVDVLVNNAGIQHVSPVEAFPIEKWDAILAINLSACISRQPDRHLKHSTCRTPVHPLGELQRPIRQD